MENFSFMNPTKIIFGKDTIKEISKEITGRKVLITYGGGSIKKNGVYDQVIKALASFEFYEFGGIEPNPHYETCMKAVDLIKEKSIDYLLAIGGGSVIDATKFIASAACFENGDPWQILERKGEIKKALTYGTVLTIAATGSEMNDGAVITKAATKDKLPFSSSLLYPKFSVLDPEITYSLPARQTGNGVVDAFVHVIEQYLTYSTEDTTFQDNMWEGILRTLISEGPKALKEPRNYDARANIMWAATWALNGWFAQGVDQDWATHLIGHELTALFGLDHGQTLAIVLPGVMRKLSEQKSVKIKRLGKEIFSIKEESSSELIDKTIQATEDFFELMGVKTHLSDYNLGDEAIEKVGNRLNERNWILGECYNITGDVAKEILKLRK